MFDFVNLIPAGRRSVGADRQARLRDVVGWLAGTRAIQRRTAKINVSSEKVEVCR